MTVAGSFVVEMNLSPLDRLIFTLTYMEIGPCQRMFLYP
jgi:hypothetical protein